MSFRILPARKSADTPLVSVCIPNYNGIGSIHQCIRSVLDQRVDGEIEIIVHDDASTDNSVEIIRKEFPSVTILAGETNCGFCKSNNRMASRARGRYLLLLNNDATLRPGAIQTLLNRARKQPLPGGIIGLPQYAMHDGSLMDRGYFFDFFLNPIPHFNENKTDVGVVTGACLWIPRGVWEQIGGFPEWFGSVAEDIYLCCAARLLGCSVECLPEPGFDHWVGRNLGGGKVVKKQLTSTIRRRALSERNKTFTMLACYPSWLLSAVIPLHLAILGIEGVLVSLLTRNPSLLMAVYVPVPFALWKNFGNLIELRRKIQRLKAVEEGAFLSVFKWLPWKIVMLQRFGLPQIR